MATKIQRRSAGAAANWAMYGLVVLKNIRNSENASYARRTFAAATSSSGSLGADIEFFRNSLESLVHCGMHVCLDERIFINRGQQRTVGQQSFARLEFPRPSVRASRCKRIGRSILPRRLASTGRGQETATPHRPIRPQRRATLRSICTYNALRSLSICAVTSRSACCHAAMSF